MINPTMRQSIQQRLEGSGQDALVVYSTGVFSILSASYLHYVTGVRPAGPQAAVIARDGRARLLVEPAWDAPRVAARTWIEDVRPTASLCRDLLAAIRELCPTGRVAGTGLADMPEDLFAALQAAAQCAPANDLVEDIALSKTAAEVALIRELGRVADAGFQAVLDHARPGIKEYELVAQIEYRMRMEGADDNFILLSTGPHNDEMHEPTERVLKAGDIIIGEITPARDGQFVQLCRTVVLGAPSDKVVGTFEMLIRAHEAALREVRPGVPAGRMSQAMNKVISDAGYAKFCYPPYMRARGHGFGVGSIAPGGAIDDDTKKPFSVNQSVVVHPNQYLEETGYLALGETVLISAGGYEQLGRTENRLYTVGA